MPVTRSADSGTWRSSTPARTWAHRREGNAPLTFWARLQPLCPLVYLVLLELLLAVLGRRVHLGPGRVRVEDEAHGAVGRAAPGGATLGRGGGGGCGGGVELGGGEGVVVVVGICYDELCGVHTASLYLFSCRTTFGATTSVISPEKIKLLYFLF